MFQTTVVSVLFHLSQGISERIISVSQTLQRAHRTAHKATLTQILKHDFSSKDLIRK